jgi:hypothetical protein
VKNALARDGWNNKENRRVEKLKEKMTPKNDFTSTAAHPAKSISLIKTQNFANTVVILY